MAILVLGGAGYIGSHTVYELIDAGRDVVVADNLQTGFRAAVHPKARFYQLDIRDKGALDTLFQAEHIDGVIHFAASSQVGESMVDPLKYYDNNLYGTMVLLRSMVEHGVKKIVFSSTAATYGEPERVPILESDKTVPTNCYGNTKLSMEQMMGWVSKAHGLRYVALRYFNACGAHPSGAIGEARRPTSSPSSSRCPWDSGRRCPSSATTTPPRTAPVSGTISTSPTWPRPTFWPWTTCSMAGTTTCSTWATAWASR